MTKQKCAVLTASRMACGHHTAEEIFEYAQTILPQISRATVYNNLHALVREGLLRPLHTDGVADRYDANAAPHGHVICSRCGGICDLFWEELSDQIQDRIGGPISSYELNVSALCAGCSAQALTENQ